jgi:transposase
VERSSAAMSTLPEPPQWPLGYVPIPPRGQTLLVPSLQAHLQRPYPDPVAPESAAAGVLAPRHLAVVLACSSRRIAREVGVHIRTSSRWCWWLRNAALSYEMHRQLDGTVEADDRSHTTGQKGQATQGGKTALGRHARGRRKQREPGRSHDDKDRPAIIAWVSHQGAVVFHATKDFTVQTVQKAADIAVHAGSRLYTDSASSSRAVKGYIHDFVNHTKKEYARGDVHENRAECLFSLLKPYLRVFRGLSKTNLPGYLGFFQFLRNFHQLTAFEQAEMILYAALDPSIASKAKRGEFVKCLDHFDLLQTAMCDPLTERRCNLPGKSQGPLAL